MSIFFYRNQVWPRSWTMCIASSVYSRIFVFLGKLTGDNQMGLLLCLSVFVWLYTDMGFLQKTVNKWMSQATVCTYRFATYSGLY